MQRSNVIPFPPTRRRSAECQALAPAGHYKFLAKDKIDILRWRARHGAVSFSRIVLHEDTGATEDTADIALVYASANPQLASFARWGLARQDGPILLWRCSDGTDLGCFADIAQVMQAVERQVCSLFGGDTPMPPPQVVSNL